MDTNVQIGTNFAPVPTHQLGLYGPVAIGPPLYQSVYDDLSYVERLRRYGVDIAFWPKENGAKPNNMGNITYTTGFFPAQCEDNQSVFIAMPDAQTPIFSGYQSTPTFTLKVRAILRRTDSEADASTEDVVFMATYEVETSSIAGGGSYEITAMNDPNNGVCSFNASYPQTYMTDYVVTNFTSSQGNQAYFPLGNNGLPFDLTLSGIDYGFTTPIGNPSTEALSSITLLDDDIQQWPGGTIQTPFGPVYEPPGSPVMFRAGQQITTDGETDLGPGVLLEIGLPDRFNGCDADPLPSPASAADIAALCTDITRYNPAIATKRSEPVSDDAPILPLTAHPNPTADRLTLRYTLSAEARVSLTLYDLTGRPVLPIQAEVLTKAGPQETSVDLSALAAGMYQVILQADGQRQGVKVVKTE